MFESIRHIFKKEKEEEEQQQTANLPEIEPSSAPTSIETYQKPTVSEIIRTLHNHEREYTSEKLIYPKTELICDHDHIEGQRIDIINKADQDIINFRFKLRAPTETITTMLEEYKAGNYQTDVTTPSGASLSRDKIIYKRVEKDDFKRTSGLDMCDAFAFERNGVKVLIADPTSDSCIFLYNEDRLARSVIGLIEIESPSDMNPEETERILQEILEEDLGIPNALGEVSEEAEKEYKEARYKWQHMIDDDLSPEQTAEAKELVRKEVFPGYTTFVEVGKHKEYLQKYGEDFRAVHCGRYASAKHIYNILKRGGYMSTIERLSRGFLTPGRSSGADIYFGGADNVFTRIMNEDQRKEVVDELTVVFSPEIFDRTDWYSYPFDRYGSTDDKVFAERLSPDALFASILSTSKTDNNEQMFRTGIGTEYIERIEIKPEIYDKIITELHSMGLSEINNKSIEEIIVPREVKVED